MLKVSSHRYWFMLTLSGLVVLITAFLISGRAETLVGSSPVVYAAEKAPMVSTEQAPVQPTACQGERRGPSFGSVVVVTSGEVICGDLTSFGGSVSIQGEVNGDVVTFAGNIAITGTVNGNVMLYGGNLALEDGAHVNGDIHTCGGSWTKGTGSQLQGSAVSCTKSLGVLLTNDSGAIGRFWFTLIWVVLGLLLTTLLPEHTVLVRTTVKSRSGRSFLLGVLSILLAPAILAVLFALIIAIPLAILVTVVLFASWVFGTVAVGWLIGDYIMRTIAPQYNKRFAQVVVGMTILALAGSIPIIGLGISIGTGLLGLGAVFLSRFGTRLYGQPRHPLQL